TATSINTVIAAAFKNRRRPLFWSAWVSEGGQHGKVTARNRARTASSFAGHVVSTYRLKSELRTGAANVRPSLRTASDSPYMPVARILNGGVLPTASGTRERQRDKDNPLYDVTSAERTLLQTARTPSTAAHMSTVQE
ncbi:hypothetical protein Bbelb_433790, partial [Branchiostoma belcheri]